MGCCLSAAVHLSRCNALCMPYGAFHGSTQQSRLLKRIHHVSQGLRIQVLLQHALCSLLLSDN